MFKKFYENTKSTIKYFGWLTLFIIPIFFVLNGFMIVGRNIQKETIISSLQIAAENELTNINLYINAQLNTVQDDLNILTNSNEAQDYALNPSPENRLAYEQMLLRFIDNKDEFLSMKIIEINGDVTYQIMRKLDGFETHDTDLESVANETYFQEISLLEQDQYYLSNFHFKHHDVSLSVVKPIYLNNIIQSYILIDVRADQFISVIDYLNQDYVSFLTFGLINDQSVILFDNRGNKETMKDQTIEIEDILQEIKDNAFIISNVFDFDKVSNQFDIIYEDDYLFYIDMDIEAAMQQSGYFLIRFPWIIAIINVIALGFVMYLAVMIRSRGENRLLTNANLYLSEEREDAVAVTDQQEHIIYVNRTFLKQYILSKEQVIHQKLFDVIGVEGMETHDVAPLNQAYETYCWTKTSTNIYVLKHLRVKGEKTFRNQYHQRISIYSEAPIVLDHYQTYVNNRQTTIGIIKKFLELKPFDHRHMSLGIIHIKQANALNFARYINNNCRYVRRVSLVTNQYVLFDAIVDDKQYQLLIQDINRLIERYYYLPTVSKDFSHSFVTTHASETLHNYEQLIDSLCVTLAVAKTNPDYKHYKYSLDIQKQLERERLIRSEIHNGYMNDEFFMVYQPQVDLKTGQYFGMEALLRWENARIGLISPYEFIPIIESSYFVNQMTSMVLKKVIQDLTPIVDQLPNDFKISINLTMFDFKNRDVIEKLIQQIKLSELSKLQFVFEITESRQLDDIKQTNQMIELLHQNHIKIAIDDFGTGYSSINALKALALDYVKIDRSFIKDYPKKDNGKMLETMIHLIHDLDKRVIVEGTETKEHITLCKNHQCEYIQGYFISRPVDIRIFMENLQQNLKIDKLK